MDSKKAAVTAGLFILLCTYGEIRVYAGNAVKLLFIESLYNGVLYFAVGIVLAALTIAASAGLSGCSITEGFKDLMRNYPHMIGAIFLGALVIAFRYGIVFRTGFLLSSDMPVDLFLLTLAARTVEMLLLMILVLGVILPTMLEYWSKWTAILTTSMMYATLQLGELFVSRGYSIEGLLSKDVAMAAVAAALMYVMLCYAYAATRRLWFPAGFIASWTIADYFVFKMMRPDMTAYDSTLDAIVLVVLLVAVFFIAKKIVNTEANEGKKEEADRFRPKRNWVK
ncbi:MAG: hypothetical protein NTU61_00015 [Candidatus Altiarchaeota archaeon]|nr:hypothetical protein [Candidatus Altiarchaeota archaeon]